MYGSIPTRGLLSILYGLFGLDELEAGTDALDTLPENFSGRRNGVILLNTQAGSSNVTEPTHPAKITRVVRSISAPWNNMILVELRL